MEGQNVTLVLVSSEAEAMTQKEVEVCATDEDCRGAEGAVPVLTWSLPDSSNSRRLKELLEACHSRSPCHEGFFLAALPSHAAKRVPTCTLVL